jgi:hypothetical protein
MNTENVPRCELRTYRSCYVMLYDFLQKRVHAGIFLGGPQALQTTRYAHDASRILMSDVTTCTALILMILYNGEHNEHLNKRSCVVRCVPHRRAIA